MADPNKGTKVLPAHAPLLQLAYGALNTQVLFIAAQLGLADRLANEGPITATNLGSELGVDASCIERVLRALVSMSICDELEGDRFQLTPLGQFLRPSHPDSVEARVLIFGQIFYRSSVNHFDDLNDLDTSRWLNCGDSVPFSCS